MKVIKSEELVIGEIYIDTPEIEEFTTFLKFVGFDEEIKSYDFEYVSGMRIYPEINGLIPFGKSQKFYQP